MYFEKQKGRNCSIHAFNNAIQYKAITCQDMKNSLDEILNDKKKHLEKRKLKKPKINVEEGIKNYKNMLMGKGGYWSIEVLSRAIEDLDYKLKVIPITENLDDKKTYILLGVKNNSYNHAIAYTKGKFLDSENLNKMAKLNSNFSPYAIYEINKL